MATPAPSFDNVKTIGEFEVSYEVYKDSANNDVIIMLVNNTADTPCNLQVTVKYLDENSEVKKTQTQTFEGFAANWSNYFIFQSMMKNSTFEYEITSTPFDGEVLSHYIHPYGGGVIIQIEKSSVELVLLKEATEKEIKKAKGVRVRLAAYSTFYGTPLSADATCILIDNNGKISFSRT